MKWLLPLFLVALGLFHVLVQGDSERALVFIDGVQVGAGIALCVANVLISNLRKAGRI